MKEETERSEQTWRGDQHISRYADPGKPHPSTYIYGLPSTYTNLSISGKNFENAFIAILHGCSGTDSP